MKIYIRSAENGSTNKQRISIAKRSTDPNELSRLAYDNSELVRLAVLQNEYTPQDTVDQLAREMVNDKSAKVRWAVAEKTNDQNLLTQLADDEDMNVRWAVAWKINDSNIITKFAYDPDGPVRLVAARRTDDLDILAKLANDEDWHVSSAARKRHKSVRPNVITTL